MDIDEFIAACKTLKNNNTGALFVIEKNNSLILSDQLVIN